MLCSRVATRYGENNRRIWHFKRWQWDLPSDIYRRYTQSWWSSVSENKCIVRAIQPLFPPLKSKRKINYFYTLFIEIRCDWTFPFLELHRRCNTLLVMLVEREREGGGSISSHQVPTFKESWLTDRLLPSHSWNGESFGLTGDGDAVTYNRVLVDRFHGPPRRY